MKYVRFLQELTRKNLPLAGGKGANLGELVIAGMKVPQGFVLTVDGYFHALTQVLTRFSSSLLKIDSKDLSVLEKMSFEIQRDILEVIIPKDVRSEILEAYKVMGRPKVAVRSSATAEDLPNASFAGQQETYLNVDGENEVLDAVKKCWASLWAPRAIHYRALQGFGETKVALAVVIQQMAPHDLSGVVFTVNPLSKNANEMVINAAPSDGAVLKFLPAPPKRQVPSPFMRAQRSLRGCLTSEQVRDLSRLCLRIEEHFGGVPQDIEWSYGAEGFYFLQSRPITTL
jgi:pyruvate, water dikinase